MPRDVPNNPTAATNGGKDQLAKLEARLSAAETKLEAVLKGTKQGLLAAANSLPAQRPGRTPAAKRA